MSALRCSMMLGASTYAASLTRRRIPRWFPKPGSHLYFGTLASINLTTSAVWYYFNFNYSGISLVPIYWKEEVISTSPTCRGELSIVTLPCCTTFSSSVWGQVIDSDPRSRHLRYRYRYRYHTTSAVCYFNFNI